MNRRLIYGSIAVLILLFFILSVVSWCDSTTVYIVRHAERRTDITPDPPLTTEGENRAIALKDHLLNKNIGSIFSTDSLRTRSTAQPLADALNTKIIIYPKGTSPVVNSQLPLHDGKSILIVGHSETILDIFRSIGASPDLVSISGNDFDNLLIATVHQYFILKWTTCEESTYGSPSP